MGTAVFRNDTLMLIFAGDPPDPSPIEEGDVLIEANDVDSALAAYDAANATNLAAIRAKRIELRDAYAAAIAAGYDTGHGFSLKLGEQDQRVLFDYQQRLLRQLGKDPAETTPATLKMVKGTDDNWHVATVQQIIDAIDGGGDHVESINGAYAGYEAMLAAGLTEFEIDFSQA